MSRWGTFALAIWLIVTALMSLLHLRFAGSAVIMPVLGLVAGLLLLVRR